MYLQTTLKESRTMKTAQISGTSALVYSTSSKDADDEIEPADSLTLTNPKTVASRNRIKTTAFGSSLKFSVLKVWSTSMG